MIPEKAELYGLRFPEKDSKTNEDYMRLSYREEDLKWLEEQKLKTLTISEQKRIPREVLADNWDEDPKQYSHKRRP